MHTEKTISSRSVYSGDIIKVKIETIRTSDGHEKSRTIVEHAEAIVVVAIDDKNNVLRSINSASR